MDSRTQDRVLGVVYIIIGIAVLWHNAHTGPIPRPDQEKELPGQVETRPSTAVEPGSRFAE